MVVGETGSEVEVEAVPAKKVKKGGRLRWQGGWGRGTVQGEARRLPLCLALRSCPGAGPLPRGSWSWGESSAHATLSVAPCDRGPPS